MIYHVLKIILVFAFFPVYTETISATHPNEKPVVYIDPLLGGKETGPILDQKLAAKTVTLNMAVKLSTLLAKRDIMSTFSREQDRFLTAAERINISRMKGADIYIAINLSQSQKDCISICYTKRLSDKYKTEKRDVGDILIDWLANKTLQESILLADSIKQDLRVKSAMNCIIVESKETYLLENSFIPTVIVDFQVVKSDSRDIYLRDAAMLDKMLQAISDGIERYYASHSLKKSQGSK